MQTEHEGGAPLEQRADQRRRWSNLARLPLHATDAESSSEYVFAAIAHLADIESVDVVLNASGRHAETSFANGMPDIFSEVVVDNLPPFHHVEVRVKGAGGHTSTITVWVPVEWNGRFLGAVGGGLRTAMPFGIPVYLRAMTMDIPLRNGFATARTDGANRKAEPAAWGLIEGTSQVDWALTENLAHRSTHEMTVIGKAVTEAIHRSPPRFSYLMGCSGGGRQALAEAQLYPDDYDGIWASDPAIHFNRILLMGLWPALVMKEAGIVLAPAKLEAFRAAAIASCDGIDGLYDGVIGAFDPCDFDPATLVGTPTEAGVICAADAEVMAKIWDGPRTRDGSFLWYGLRPGTESWGNNLLATGLCCSKSCDGRAEITPFELSVDYVRAWIVRDLSWDWRTLTYADFDELFHRSATEMGIIACDDPDLSAFRDAGGKLILSHGADDQLIPAAGTIEYYRRVVAAAGGEEAARAFVRLFVSEGDGHALFTDGGPGLLVEHGMAALMAWVEQGEAPEEILAHRMDFATDAVIASRPVYAYPFVPEYKGEGDPNCADSFKPVNLSSRQERAAACAAK